MKSNTKVNNGVVKYGEYAFVRKPVTVEAYGEKFELPVKTVDFCDKLDAIGAESLKTTKSSETTRILKKGIALFIGDEKTEQLFPEEQLGELNSDEIFGFWAFLKHEQNAQQRELIALYR